MDGGSDAETCDSYIKGALLVHEEFNFTHILKLHQKPNRNTAK